jgi:hypothetical protein
LWPSFNVVEFSEDYVRLESVSFSPKQNTRVPVRRDLARARRIGPKWDAEPVTFRAGGAAPRVDLDEATFALSRSRKSPGRWDFVCERRVSLREGARLARYIDFVHALPVLRPRSRGGRRAYRRVELRIGKVTRSRVPEGLCRTLDEGARSYGVGAAFEWVGLLCRYGAAQATLRLSRTNAEGLEPFASVTDLTTGREVQVPVESTDEQWSASCHSCAPRSLLRLYWPLART